jgi:hypothetical protein
MRTALRCLGRRRGAALETDAMLGPTLVFTRRASIEIRFLHCTLALVALGLYHIRNAVAFPSAFLRSAVRVLPMLRLSQDPRSTYIVWRQRSGIDGGATSSLPDKEVS